MNLVVGSAFRNTGHFSLQYLERVKELQHFFPKTRVIAVEGDSTDDTRAQLERGAKYHKIPLDLRTCNHGGPVFGSVETTERMVALSKVGNAIFDGVVESDDVLLYIECDLIWRPRDLVGLIQYAAHNKRHVIAPLVMAGPHFYDIWGFRGLDGNRFGPFPPYYPGLADRPFEVGSVGSCLAMSAEIARRCRIRNDYCLVGWCEDARNHGYRIYVDPNTKVRQV
jgi:hypothetical protein